MDFKKPHKEKSGKHGGQTKSQNLVTFSEKQPLNYAQCGCSIIFLKTVHHEL